MTRLAEAQSGIALTVSGLVFINPLTDTFASIPAYSSLAWVAPEMAWGLVMLAAGVYQLLSLRGDDVHHRGHASFLSACLFLSASAALLSQPTPRMSLAMGAFPSFFLAQGYTYLNLRSERRRLWLT